MQHIKTTLHSLTPAKKRSLTLQPISEAQPPSQPSVQRTLTPSSQATVALLTRRGVTEGAIACVLGLEERTVKAMQDAMPQDTADLLSEIGRMLLKAAMEEPKVAVVEEPRDLCCPISLCLFSDPVIASDGYVYERKNIQNLMSHCNPEKRLVSPMTRVVLQPSLFPAHEHRRRANEWREQACDQLCKLACAAAETAEAEPMLEKCWEYLQELGMEIQPSRMRQVLDACIECAVAPAWDAVFSFFLHGRAEQLVDRWTGLQRIGLDIEMIASAGLCVLQRAARAQGHEAALAAVEAELEERGQLRPKSAPAVATGIAERVREWQDGVMDIHLAYAKEARRQDLQSRAGAAMGRWGPKRSQQPSAALMELEPMDVE